MATRSVATVFGGSGFIGRYVVQRLCHAGKIVRVAVRDTEGALFLKTMGQVGQVVRRGRHRWNVGGRRLFHRDRLWFRNQALGRIVGLAGMIKIPIGWRRRKILDG